MNKSKYGHRTLNWFEAIVNKLRGEEGAEAFLRGDLVVAKPAPNRRLREKATAECPQIEEFVAKKNFGKNKTINGVKFWDLGDNFVRVFLPLVETNIEAATLRSHELLRPSKDLGILREVEESKEITTLCHLHHLLSQQGEGQEGVLLVNGYANIFYIVGNDGNLWAVRADWYGGRGWRVYARPVECPNEWGAGDRAFSR